MDPHANPDSLSASDLHSTSQVLDVRHGFEVAGHRFLLPKGMYCEITNRSSICAIPDTPSSFLGFINHRGETVPVFSVQRLLDATAEVNGRWVLLLDSSPRTIGLLLDAYPKGLNGVEAVAEQGPGHEVLDQFCRGSYRHGGDHWREFDYPRFCEYVKQSFALTLPVAM